MRPQGQRGSVRELSQPSKHRFQAARGGPRRTPGPGRRRRHGCSIFTPIAMNSENTIPLVMVEDNLDLAQTVADFLRGEPRLALAGIAHNRRDFEGLIAAHLPEIALI